MKTTIALFVALLLTATEFLVMDHDTRQRVAVYQDQTEAPAAIAVRE